MTSDAVQWIDAILLTRVVVADRAIFHKSLHAGVLSSLHRDKRHSGILNKLRALKYFSLSSGNHLL